MKTQYLAVTAMALLLAGPSFAAPSRAQRAAAHASKSRPVVATRSATLDLTGMD